MAPDCESEWSSRGLCWKHYNQALGYVKKGKTTWSDLEKRGVAKPSGGQGSPAGTAWLNG